MRNKHSYSLVIFVSCCIIWGTHSFVVPSPQIPSVRTTTSFLSLAKGDDSGDGDNDDKNRYSSVISVNEQLDEIVELGRSTFSMNKKRKREMAEGDGISTISDDDNIMMPSQDIPRKDVLRAQHLFQSLSNPNTKSYTTMIQIYAKSDPSMFNAHLLAHELLDEMIRITEQQDNEKKKNTNTCIPNTVTFTSVISAYAIAAGRRTSYVHPKKRRENNQNNNNNKISPQLQNAQTAEEILYQMMEMHLDPEKRSLYHDNIEPNSITFDTVLNAYTRAAPFYTYAQQNNHINSNNNNARDKSEESSLNPAEKAERILEEMNYLHIKSKSFTHVKPRYVCE